MINLLPPEVKTAVRYSRYNAVLVRYLRLTLTVFLILAGALMGARYYLNQQIQVAINQVKTTQDQINSPANRTLQTRAASLTTRLAAIQSVQKSQAKFSVLLSDLAKYMPDGTKISSIAFTGDDTQPVRLSVTATDYKTALGFRDSIARSKRISAADIEDIKGAAVGNQTFYTVTVVFAFNPGQAQ